MKRKVQVFVTMLAAIIAVSFAAVGAAEAKSKKSVGKQVVRKSVKRPTLAKASKTKKISAEKKRQHAALVARLKEQERQAKENGAPASIESSILEKSKVDRATASSPRPKSGDSPLVEKSQDLADVELDFDDSVGANGYLPSATEEQLDTNGEF